MADPKDKWADFEEVKPAAGADPVPAEPPPSHRWAGPYLNLHFVEHRFIKRTGIFVPGRDADFNLGTEFTVSSSVSGRIVALDTTPRAAVGAATPDHPDRHSRTGRGHWYRRRSCRAAPFALHERGRIEVRQSPGFPAALHLHEAVTRRRIGWGDASVHDETDGSPFVDEFDLRSRRQTVACADFRWNDDLAFGGERCGSHGDVPYS